MGDCTLFSVSNLVLYNEKPKNHQHKAQRGFAPTELIQDPQ